MLTLSTDPAFNAVHHLSVALHRFLAKKICKRKVDQDQCMEKQIHQNILTLYTTVAFEPSFFVKLSLVLHQVPFALTQYTTCMALEGLRVLVVAHVVAETMCELLLSTAQDITERVINFMDGCHVKPIGIEGLLRLVTNRTT